ncbi:RIPOR family member 3 [Takifugu flavidus]|uniref:RIPOR family member 3 n=1 Tax=Takifugu flavidus TaxID=433684 RepID=A0A5C6MM98_9TELE|nr:RIPOR family member 3 [Takifugu flavidus]
MHPWSSREDRAVWPLQLHDVDAVFQVLLRGLREILESQQGEMDFLVSQQRDTKRDSRLAFIYDLEKEIRALERAIRRVEFQLSKCEAVCQGVGVVNMKKAFARSPPTRACRESLLELSRSHRHSLQVWTHILVKCCQSHVVGVIKHQPETFSMRYRTYQKWKELEILLGELHIKMKGDGIEGSELASGWHGDVRQCRLLVSKPQLMLVDITELGTIKLQLEIAWNPFDSGEKMKRLSLSRLSVSARRNPLHGRTAGQSPSFTEKYFLSMARRLQEVEGISAAVDSASRHDTGGVSPLSYPFNIPDATFLSSNNPQNATRFCKFSLHLHSDSSEFEPHSFPALPTVTIQPAAASPSPPAAPPETSVGQHRARALRIGAQISELSNLLPSQPCSEQELRALRHNLLHLATILKETLGLEEVLGSFDFLSHDINADEDASCLGTLRKPGLSWSWTAWLTSGDDGLDQALEFTWTFAASSYSFEFSSADKGSEELGPGRHPNCCTVIFPQRMRASRFRPSRQELLQELSLQAEALQRVSHLLLEKNKISSTDILPQVQRTREFLLFWEACVSGSSSSPFLCDADSFCATLRKVSRTRWRPSSRARRKSVSPGCWGSSRRRVARCRTSGPSCCPDRVTLFQLSAYLRRWASGPGRTHHTPLQKRSSNISDVSTGGAHPLSSEEPKRRRTLNKLRAAGGKLLPLVHAATLAALQATESVDTS